MDKNIINEDGQLGFADCFAEQEPEYSTSVTSLIRKSNTLINRIGSVTLMSEKILLVALANVKVMNPAKIKGTRDELYYRDVFNKTGTNFGEGLISVFSNTELRKALKSKSGSYYETIDKLMNSPAFTNNWNIIYRDKDIIGHTNLVMGTLYDNRTGKIYIKWNADMASKITDLKSNYTELDRDIMFRFKSIYSFSIYQMLRSKLPLLESINAKKGLPPQSEYRVEYNLSEFKFLSRIISVDTTSKSKKTIASIRQIESANYESAEFELPEESSVYKSYSELKRSVLNKAYLEINGFEDPNSVEEYEVLRQKHHKTDIHYRYEPIRTGIGGKVTSVAFYISWDKPGESKAKPIVEAESFDKDAFLDDMSCLIDEHLRIKEMRSIAEAADWNFSKIEKAYTVAKEAPRENLVGFIISAIKNDYEPATKTYGANNNVFNTFEQRNYDYDALEKALLGRTEED